MESKLEVDECGNKRWKNEVGELHRLDGPAIEYVSGAKYWYVNGRQHRLDGPAIEMASGTKEWYVNGKWHRLDGPAVEWADGEEWWYINGVKFTKQQFNDHPDVCMHRLIKSST